MQIFSNEISNFLTQNSIDRNLELTWLGLPSGSMLSIGDILLFHYDLQSSLPEDDERGSNLSFPVTRVGLIVRPITKEAAT